MAEIVWTVEALNCLEQIHHYIAADNPKAARNVVIGIYDKIQMLVDRSPFPVPKLLPPDLRLEA